MRGIRIGGSRGGGTLRWNQLVHTVSYYMLWHSFKVANNIKEENLLFKTKITSHKWQQHFEPHDGAERVACVMFSRDGQDFFFFFFFPAGPWSVQFPSYSECYQTGSCMCRWSSTSQCTLNAISSLKKKNLGAFFSLKVSEIGIFPIISSAAAAVLWWINRRRRRRRRKCFISDSI